MDTISEKDLDKSRIAFFFFLGGGGKVSGKTGSSGVPLRAHFWTTDLGVSQHRGQMSGVPLVPWGCSAGYTSKRNRTRLHLHVMMSVQSYAHLLFIVAIFPRGRSISYAYYFLYYLLKYVMRYAYWTLKQMEVYPPPNVEAPRTCLEDLVPFTVAFWELRECINGSDVGAASRWTLTWPAWCISAQRCRS